MLEFNLIPINIDQINAILKQIESCGTARLKSLVFLYNLCANFGIEIDNIGMYMNGFKVTFKGLDGDAILHDASYGKENKMWETYGFPWDKGDVTVHEPEELVKLLREIRD